ATFTFKFGISYGKVYAGFIGSRLISEYTAIGGEVNLASRLMEKAGWNETLVDAEVMKKNEKTHEFLSEGMIEVKGFSTEINIYKLLTKKEKKFQTEGILIGREKEIEEITGIIESISSGRFGGIIEISGEPGIGKSKLVEEVRKRTGALKLNWFVLPCDEISQSSFHPILYFLKKYFNQSDDLTAKENLAKFNNKFSELMNQIPDTGISNELKRTKGILGALLDLFWRDPLYESLDSAGRYENTIISLKNLLKGIAKINPMILNIEDFHFADSDSLVFIQNLLRNIEEYPILLIITLRKGYADKLNILTSEEYPIAKINLDRLSKESISEMLKHKLYPDYPPELLEIIYSKSGGNPFFVEQIILYLKEHYNLKKTSGEIKSIPKNFEIPDKISSIIISRIDRLEREIKDVIKSASVLGMEFSIKVLSLMLQNKLDDNYLETIQQEDIWVAISDLRFIFKHLLIRDTVYEMQLKRTLLKLHKLAGESIETVFKRNQKEHYGELAFHYEKAKTRAKTVYYLEKAGDLAFDNYHNTSALEYYLKLLAYIKGEHSLQFIIRTAEIYETLGRWDDGLGYFKKGKTLAKKYQKDKELFKIYIQMMNLYRKTGQDKKVFNLINKEIPQILMKVDKVESWSKYYQNIGYYYHCRGEYKKAKEYIENALEILKESKIKSDFGDIYNYLGMVVYYLGDYKEATKYYNKALKIFEKKKDKKLLGTIYGNLGLLYKDLGDYKKAMEVYQKKLKISEELGYREGINVALGNIGIIYKELGEYDKALEYYRKKLEISEELGDIRNKALALGNIGVIYFHQNKIEESRINNEEQLKIARKLNDKYLLTLAYTNLANVYQAEGDNEKAIKSLESALEITETTGNLYATVIILGNLALVCYKTGRIEESGNSFRRASAIAEEMNDKQLIAITKGSMGQYYSDIGKMEESLEYFNSSLEILQELKLKPYICYYLYYKALSLFKLYKSGKLDSITEIEKMNQEAMDIAEEIQDKDVLIDTKILSATIRGEFDKKEAENLFKKILSEIKNNEKSAEIFEGLFNLTKDKKYLKNELLILEELYSQNDAPYLLKRIDDLKAILNTEKKED
ncbi:MAG: tetratricopeptide repeat protein, partial [bacterium]|nr:tetratricopeptide repeat protein [bacterium]